MEEVEMRQKAEKEWVIFGDRCSKKFHMLMKAKNNRNAICQLNNAQGASVTNIQEIAKYLEDYFASSIGTNNSDSVLLDNLEVLGSETFYLRSRGLSSRRKSMI